MVLKKETGHICLAMTINFVYGFNPLQLKEEDPTKYDK